MTADENGQTQSFSIKSRQGFMIFPNQITTYIADKDLPWEYVWVEFDGLRVKSILDACGFSPNNPVYHAKSKDLREEMMNEMIYITQNQNSSPIHLIGHLYLFLDYLARSTASAPLSSGSSLRDFYIHEALNYIEHNFQNDITVEDIADVCGLNRSYFGKIFKNAVGKTPQEFLLSYPFGMSAMRLDMPTPCTSPEPSEISTAFRREIGGIRIKFSCLTHFLTGQTLAMTCK